MENKNEITASKINTDFIEQQATAWKEAAEKAKTAADAYLADLEQRKAALAEQAAGYQAQLDKLNAKRKILAAQINDLSSRGKIDEAAEADAKLEALDKTIATLERKLRLVNGAELKGDPDLYQAAKAAHEAMNAESVPYRESIAVLRGIVDTEIERLKSMANELWRALDRSPDYYAAATFEKVDRHYRDLDRIEREWNQQEASRRNAAEKERGATRYIMA